MLMLSNVTVLNSVLSCEHTARPTSTLLERLSDVRFVATCIHVWPSLDRQALTVLPERINRTQCGTIGPLTCATSTAAALVVERYCRLTPCDDVGVTYTP